MNTTECISSMSKKNKGRYNAPKNPDGRLTGKVDKFAYTIVDKSFGEFKVLNSSRAWWLDRSKLDRIIIALKNDFNEQETALHAGISVEQFNYFIELHPEFVQIKELLRQTLGSVAKSILATSVQEKNLDMVKWYLSRKRKAEYGDSLDVTSKGKQLSQPQNAIVFIDSSEDEE